MAVVASTSVSTLARWLPTAHSTASSNSFRIFKIRYQRRRVVLDLVASDTVVGRPASTQTKALVAK